MRTPTSLSATAPDTSDHLDDQRLMRILTGRDEATDLEGSHLDDCQRCQGSYGRLAALWRAAANIAEGPVLDPQELDDSLELALLGDLNEGELLALSARLAGTGWSEARVLRMARNLSSSGGTMDPDALGVLLRECKVSEAKRATTRVPTATSALPPSTSAAKALPTVVPSGPLAAWRRASMRWLPIGLGLGLTLLLLIRSGPEGGEAPLGALPGPDPSQQGDPVIVEHGQPRGHGDAGPAEPVAEHFAARLYAPVAEGFSPTGWLDVSEVGTPQSCSPHQAIELRFRVRGEGYLTLLHQGPGEALEVLHSATGPFDGQERSWPSQPGAPTLATPLLGPWAHGEHRWLLVVSRQAAPVAGVATWLTEQQQRGRLNQVKSLTCSVR